MTNCNLLSYIAQNLDIEIICLIKCSKDFQLWQLACKESKIKQLVQKLQQKTISFSILSVKPEQNPTEKSQLTPRQIQIYKLALMFEYFDYPRRNSFSKLATVAEIIPSSISVMMKRILSKLNTGEFLFVGKRSRFI